MYGPEGQRYPVQAGEVWACGAHTFRCGDLRDWSPPMHALIYSDPPWGQAALNGFYTAADLGSPPYAWQDIYRLVMNLSLADLWLECGLRQVEEVVSMMPRTWIEKVPIVYGRDKPAALIYGGNEQPPLTFAPGEHDDNTPRMVMDAYGTGLTVLDPCAGRGLTSRCAERSGWASVNNELNPLRVSAALARMHRLTGEAVECVE